MRRPALLIAFVLLAGCVSLAACNGHDNTGTNANGEKTSAESLPAPQGTRGSVTGMPDAPGPGQVGPPTDETLAVDTSEEDVDLDTGDGEDATSPDVANEPTPQDAVAVIRDYYAAINARDFSRAHALWSDGGNASGQTPQQFADGFADTASVSATIDVPGQIGAAAGSRYIEVPVAVTAEQRDGSTRRFVGAYTLRRAVVDGATDEQRAWRITSADIREVTTPR
jgi:hypothetical protein